MGRSAAFGTTICRATLAEILVISKFADLRMTQLNYLFRLMADSIELNTFARARVNERRYIILSDITSSYRHLSNKSRPEGSFLFDNALEGARKSVELANRLS